MHLLYLDDSGSIRNKNEAHFVLGGLAVFERQINWLSEALDNYAVSLFPGYTGIIEFHASEIFSGRSEPWKNITDKQKRVEIIKNVLRILANSHDSVKAFACVINKNAIENDPIERAIEDLCSRFDMRLTRIFKEEGDKQRGMLILDEASYKNNLQSLVLGFRKIGTKWGTLKNILEVPFFVDSHLTRLIQLADHVAYSTFRRYEHGDCSYFDIISHKFDSDNYARIHGLAHIDPTNPNCLCPACLSRKLSNNSRTEIGL